jgi:excisionase family DNA binding protein
MDGIMITGISKEDFFKELKETLNEFKPAPKPAGLETELLTPAEVCKLLKISKPTLHNWTNKGMLNPMKVQRRVYYNRTDIFNLSNFKKNDD